MGLVIPAWSLTYHQTQHNNLGSVVLFYLLHLLPLKYQTILPLESRSVSEMLFFFVLLKGIFNRTKCILFKNKHVFPSNGGPTLSVQCNADSSSDASILFLFISFLSI